MYPVQSGHKGTGIWLGAGLTHLGRLTDFVGTSYARLWVFLHGHRAPILGQMKSRQSGLSVGTIAGHCDSQVTLRPTLGMGVTKQDL